MLLFLFFLFGLSIGSFLNASLYRMKLKKSVFKGRSSCPHCSHVLSWKDLIPIVSFLFLLGKCRYCSKPISFQYPAVELGTGLLFVLIAYVVAGSVLSLTLYWILASFLIFIFVYDLKHFLIPDIVVYPAIATAFLYRLLVAGELLSALGSALVATAFFLALFLVSKGRWMGFGDVKLALFMGLFLSWPVVLVAFFVAFFVGGFVGTILILLKKKGLKSEIPFGPFLVFGTFTALFWGEQIVDWYLGFLVG